MTGNNNEFNILVVDDEKTIADAIEIYLKTEGYNVVKAYDGMDAVEKAKQGIHLIIMDVMMPKLDGIQATIRIREKNNIPIIFLSAKSEDYDKITGLNIGGDDYITKPFNPLELIARVKSQLRRYVNFGGLNPENVQTGGVYKTGELILNDNTKEVTVDGEPICLTPREFGILKFLMENMGRVFSIEQIYEKVWEEPAFSPENTVAVHVRRIREKIEIEPKNPKYLKVVWGIGYKIEKL